jgi:Peptidase family M28
MKFRFSLFFLALAGLASAQSATPRSDNHNLPDPLPYAELIAPASAKAVLDVLAAPAMEGRETGENGQRKAADFLAGQFKSFGIPPIPGSQTYFQPILLRNESWSDVGIKIGDKEYRNRTDFYVFPAFNSDQPKIELKEAVFVGFGIEEGSRNDYNKAKVKGKAVIFFKDEPKNAEGASLISNSATPSEWTSDWRKKVRLAKQKGATLAIVIDPSYAENIKANRRLLSTYGWRPVKAENDKQADEFINTVFVGPALAEAILGDKAAAANAVRNGGEFKKAFSVKTKMQVRLDKESKKLEGSNVLGVIEGTDPVLKNEYVFITAHYDHLGMSDKAVLYPGADDNASGTTGVTRIAQAFAEAKKNGVGPKRTVVCMLVSGEEKGLLGSEYYAEFPIFPLDKTVVDINIDMIGREDDEHAGKGDYVHVIGSNRLSTALHAINEAANTRYTQLLLDYKYNDKNDPNHFYERSDHYNFAERGIPAIFYFNGTHPDYHKTTDTADKINFDLLAKRARLAFFTAWELANRPERIVVDVKE